MSNDRDVTAFARRASRYDHGWLGRFHRQIVMGTVEVVLSAQPHPRRILDVGCGTGHLLRVLAARCPEAVELAGVDPAGPMIDVARAATDDPRITVTVGHAEHLPYDDGRFDVVVSTTSFDHWANQSAGVAECARVLAGDGRLIITDLFSPWLVPTLIASRRDRARTKPRAQRLLTGRGLRAVAWHDLVPLIGTVVAAPAAPARGGGGLPEEPGAEH